MTVVLVEGESDKAALDCLAARCGVVGLEVVAIGGATNVRRCLAQYEGSVVVGLVDAQEAPAFRRAMGGRPLSVCDADLEDELVRALGTEAVERIIEAQGELRSFRTLQRQPAQRDRPLAAQMHRFMGTKSRRKIVYARLMAEALDLARIPPPLHEVLTRH